MPTENRSSNTEMVSVPRELTPEMREAFHVSYEAYEDGRGECPDSQWRAMLRAAPQRAPQPQAEPIAWMVGTAIWRTKEEAERDAAATGLPVVPVGPMLDTAEVEQLRAALKFYADRDHFSEDMGSDWDSVSGEPANILWHEDEAWFVEDGSIARAALERKP